jgi:hypothetical protein
MGRPTNAQIEAGVAAHRQYIHRIESGDMWLGIQHLAEAERSEQDENERTRSLRMCVESAANGGPAELIDELMAHVLKFDTRLLLIAQAMALRFENFYDRDSNGNFDKPHERRTQELWLGRVIRTQERILETAQTYARMRHVLALAKPKPRTKPKIVYMNQPAAAKEASAGG